MYLFTQSLEHELFVLKAKTAHQTSRFQCAARVAWRITYSWKRHLLLLCVCCFGDWFISDNFCASRNCSMSVLERMLINWQWRLPHHRAVKLPHTTARLAATPRPVYQLPHSRHTTSLLRCRDHHVSATFRRELMHLLHNWMQIHFWFTPGNAGWSIFQMEDGQFLLHEKFCSLISSASAKWWSFMVVRLMKWRAVLKDDATLCIFIDDTGWLEIVK